MSEHAVIIPTEIGPIGGIVSEPEVEQRGALVLLPGVGPPCRAGVNGVWTHIARDLAALGLVVLRFDLACEGDSTLVGRDVPRERGWRRCTDLAMLREAVPWFLERAGESEVLLASSCHGARIALEFAADDPVAAGLFLAVPYLWHFEPNLRGLAEEDLPPGLDGRVWAKGPTLDSDAALVEGFRTSLAQGSVWVLAGDGDEEEQVLPFARQLERTGASFELEIAPGMPLHPFGHPEQQARVRRRLVDRVARALTEREGLVPSTR